MDDPTSLAASLSKALPGIAGSFVSMLFLGQVGWMRRVGMFVSGAAISRYVGPSFSAWAGLDGSAAGFLVGLFGMALVASVFQAWQQLELGPLLRDKLRSMLGLPPKG